MSQSTSEKVKNKINEDLSPTKNLTGLHLKIVAAIAIIWSLFQLRLVTHLGPHTQQEEQLLQVLLQLLMEQLQFVIFQMLVLHQLLLQLMVH